MPIRNQDDSISKVEQLEREWFKKAEMFESEPSRFGFSEYGKRNGYWETKKDITNEYTNDTVFLIDHERFVNRPDAISHTVYGNSKYWWMIALKNNIKNPFHEFYKGRKLLIPDFVIVKEILGY